jgi:hypothetical protein
MNDQIANGADNFGPHYGVQGYMMAGMMGYEDGGVIYTDSYHATDIGNQCVICHMAPAPASPLDPGHGQVGDHTFAMTALSEDIEAQNTAESCNQGGCHAGLSSYDRLAEEDFDGDGIVEGVQTEIRELLNELGRRLPPYDSPMVGSALDDTNSGVTQRRAAWNWHFVSRDRSHGIHNTDYTVKLLQISIASLPELPDPIFSDGFESGG